MVAALRSLSYEGTVVYLHDNRLELLQIVHRVEDGQVWERLVFLNGPPRTLSRPILVPGRDIGKDGLPAGMLDPETLRNHYEIHSLGDVWVAGRDTTEVTTVVGVVPRDRLRYGYRFYLDWETGLPLKSDLNRAKGIDPIEQIMFVSLDLLPVRDPAPVVGVVPQLRRSGSRHPAPDCLSWQFDALPSGFVLSNVWRLARDRWVAGRPFRAFGLLGIDLRLCRERSAGGLGG